MSNEDVCNRLHSRDSRIMLFNQRKIELSDFGWCVGEEMFQFFFPFNLVVLVFFCFSWCKVKEKLSFEHFR